MSHAKRLLQSGTTEPRVGRSNLPRAAHALVRAAETCAAGFGMPFAGLPYAMHMKDPR